MLCDVSFFSSFSFNDRISSLNEFAQDCIDVATSSANLHSLAAIGVYHTRVPCKDSDLGT